MSPRWGMTPRRTYRETVSRNVTLTLKQFALLAVCFLLVSCLAFSSTLKMEETCSSEMSVEITGIQGVIFQKRDLFTVTTVWTSNQPLISTLQEGIIGVVFLMRLRGQLRIITQNVDMSDLGIGRDGCRTSRIFFFLDIIDTGING
jgi:hypothetical protein